MSDDLDLEQLEHQARADAIQSIKVRSLPQIGPTPVGRWINIGIGRKATMDALGLSADEAAAIIAEHLGKTIPFRFATWSVVASIKIDDFAAQPMVHFDARDSAPDFALSTFRDLFFWGDNVDHLQWSTGTFGGMTRGRWHLLLSGRAVTIHEITVHGTVIDDLAFHRALGLPHDENLLAINSSNVTATAAHDITRDAHATAGNGSGGRARAGEGTWETQLFGELLGRATGGGWMPGGPAAVDRGGSTLIKEAILDWLSVNNHAPIADSTAKLIAARLLIILKEIRKAGG